MMVLPNEVKARISRVMRGTGRRKVLAEIESSGDIVYHNVPDFVKHMDPKISVLEFRDKALEFVYESHEDVRRIKFVYQDPREGEVRFTFLLKPEQALALRRAIKEPKR